MAADDAAPHGRLAGAMTDQAASPLYDTIGVGYSTHRRPDPRLAAFLAEALAGARTVVDVGAGAGSYEPESAEVTAVDPARVMLDQHPGPEHRKVLGSAEELPFADGTFDAAMAVMTVHHWADWRRGTAEMRRVARRQVLYTWDPEHDEDLWIVRDYLPEMGVLDRGRCPRIPDLVDALGAHSVLPFEVPHDFTDGSQAAYWRRPQAFLDPLVRAASSTFRQLPPQVVDAGIARLAADLASGAWERRYADLLDRDSIDLGFRLLVAGE